LIFLNTLIYKSPDGALAVLCFRDCARIAGSRLPEALNALDVLRTDGKSFNLRPPSRFTIYRLDELRFYCYFLESTREMHAMLATGIVGVVMSADLTSLIGNELMTSSFSLMGSSVLPEFDVDGQRKYNSFSKKFENPLLTLAGKTGRDLAEAILALLKLRRIVLDDATVETCAEVIPDCIVAWVSDQGSENTGGWRNAREKEGDGGLIALLFVRQQGQNRVRKVSYQSCLQHDPQNLDHATQSSALMASRVEFVSKFLRQGTRQKHYTGLILYLAGASETSPLTGEGATMLEEVKRSIIIDPQCAETIRRRFIAPGKTRFGTISIAANNQLIVRNTLAPVIAIVEGRGKTMEQSREVLRHAKDGNKKAGRCVTLLENEPHAFHMRLAFWKHNIVIWPIMSASALGHHCAATLMGGTFGVIAKVRRTLRKALHRFDLAALKLRNPVYYARLLTELQGKNAPDFIMPEEFSMPRKSTFTSVMVGPIFERKLGRISAVIVCFVHNLIIEYDARILRQALRIEMLIAATAREYSFKLLEERPVVVLDEKTLSDLIAKRSKTLAKLREGLSFEKIAALTVAVDSRVIAVAPLTHKEQPTPTFATQLEVVEGRTLVASWDRLSNDERTCYPPKIRALLLRGGPLRKHLEAFCLGETNPRTSRPWSLRHWPDLHEHIFGFCGALFKTTSIDREWAFSVASCGVLRCSRAGDF
jgi:hypothetical protein